MRILTSRHPILRALSYSTSGESLYACGESKSRKFFGQGLDRWELGNDETSPVPLHELSLVGEFYPLANDARIVREIDMQDSGPKLAFCPADVEFSSRIPFPQGCSNWIAISPDESRFILGVPLKMGGWEMACFDLDEDLRTNPLWVRSYDVPTPGTRVYGSSMEFSPTGNFVLSVERYVYSDGGSTTLSRWRSAADGASVGDGIILQPSTTSVRLSCDATRFFTLNGNSLHSYDATGTSAAFERVSSGNRKHFTDIAVHPDGRRVIATCNEATVREFDAVTLRELRAYDWKAGRLRCVAIAPDGLTAAAGSDTGKVVVWDLE